MFGVHVCDDGQAAFLEKQRKRVATDLQQLRVKASWMKKLGCRYEESRKRLNALINILSVIKSMCFVICLTSFGIQKLTPDVYWRGSIGLLVPFLIGFTIHLFRDLMLFQFKHVSDTYFDIQDEGCMLRGQIERVEKQHLVFAMKLLIKARHCRLRRQALPDWSG